MLATISGWILSACGWRILGSPPNLKKYVVIIAPHTSNWDFFIFLLLKFYFRLKVRFIGKHTVFIGPFGWYLKKIGGIPIDRKKGGNVVQTIVDEFERSEQMVFALSPEGTRSYKDHWKTGFYFIAVQARVPLQPCFLDCKTKTLGFADVMQLTGDIDQDFVRLREIFADKQGVRPELFSKIDYQRKNQG